MSDIELDAQQAEKLRIAGLYKAIFADDRRGAAVLEDLSRKFAKGAARGFGQDAITETFVRSHQRLIFDHIYLQMNLAEGVIDEPPTNEGHSDDDLP